MQWMLHWRRNSWIVYSLLYEKNARMCSPVKETLHHEVSFLQWRRLEFGCFEGLVPQRQSDPIVREGGDREGTNLLCEKTHTGENLLKSQSWG